MADGLQRQTLSIAVTARQRGLDEVVIEGTDELITQLLRIGGLMDQAAPLEFVKNRLHKLKTGFRLKLNFVFFGHRPTHIGEGLF